MWEINEVTDQLTDTKLPNSSFARRKLKCFRSRQEMLRNFDRCRGWIISNKRCLAVISSLIIFILRFVSHSYFFVIRMCVSLIENKKDQQVYSFAHWSYCQSPNLTPPTRGFYLSANINIPNPTLNNNKNVLPFLT